MICFDKLKIISSINYIKEIDKTKFQSSSINEILQYDKYKQKIPSSLLIMVNYTNNELVIEFTSKILKDNFIHLINKDNIYECLNNINQLDICRLDIDNIINHSKIVKCDPVKDIVCQDIKALQNYTNSNLSNYNKWKNKIYKNGFVIENVVGTSRYKKRIVVYDKGKELKKSDTFLHTLSDKKKYLLYYQDKIRIEMNINTEIQIRQLLDITDNQLLNVLNSNANPIFAVLNEAVKETSVNTQISHSFKEYQKELVLKDCDFDLNKVEAKVRGLSSKNTQIAKIMKPYRELYHRLQENTIPMFDIRKLVA